MMITLGKTMSLQTAVNMLPVEGGTILAPNWQWDVYDAVVFPVGKQVPGYITNVCFQGESSGLACGSVGNPFGTQLNFSGPGTIFDLRGQKCINVQFRDFEVFDTNGSSVSGILRRGNGLTGVRRSGNADRRWRTL